MRRELFPVEQEAAVRQVANSLDHDVFRKWYASLDAERVSSQGIIYTVSKTKGSTPHVKTFSLAFSPEGQAYPRITMRGRQRMVSDSSGRRAGYRQWTPPAWPLAWRENTPSGLDLIVDGSRIGSLFEPALATVHDTEPITPEKAEQLLLAVSSLVVSTQLEWGTEAEQPIPAQESTNSTRQPLFLAPTLP